MFLYRIAYETPTGRIARLTLAAHPGDILRMASSIVRGLGWLLSIAEDRPLQRPQLRLV